MQALESYIPADRYRTLVMGLTLPDYSEGVALFADISGFTPLTETLATRLGPRRGAEELTHYLNTVYDALITQVYGYGGSVISFSGDAITCWFDADNGSRAVACALEMQKALAKVSQFQIASVPELTIAMKVGIAAGKARRFLIGAPDLLYIDTMAGTTISRMTQAEHLAQPGEVVIASEVYTTLQDNLLIKEWRKNLADDGQFAVVGDLLHSVKVEEETNWLKVTEGSLAESELRSWLLPPVYERWRADKGAYLAELRPAVALFVSFDGLDYDNDPAAGEKLDGFLCQVLKVVQRYEGYLLQLTIGDKGSYFYIVFGAPLAHEDDAERAVRVAFELQLAETMPAWLTDFRSGITRGTMWCGAYGSSLRRTYGVLGKSVNLAARLMQAAAPGSILCDWEVYNLVKEKVAFEILAPLKVKGVEGPVQIYRPKQLLARSKFELFNPQPQTDLVGRQAERSRLESCLQQLQTSRSSQTEAPYKVVVIEGEAGIGKSQLLTHLIHQTYSANVRLLTGSGNAIEQFGIYYAWREVFFQLFSLKSETDLPAQQAQVMAQLEAKPAWLNLAPLLNEVLLLALPENEYTSILKGSARAENTRELMVDLLQNAAEQSPLLVIIDDAQWLDSASWALLLAVSQRVESILLVIATRPQGEPIPASYNQLLNLPRTLKLNLTALSADEISALISLRLGVTGLPEPLARLIWDKAEGHPFFSEELAYALRDIGEIVIEGTTCRIETRVEEWARQLNLPDSVQDVITSRVDRLLASQRMTLKVASIFGRVFARQTLYEVYPVESDKPEIDTHLVSLKNLEFIMPEQPDPQPTYAFKHIITQEVVYNLMLFAQRSELHRQVAQWYEITQAQTIEQYYPLLAYHWSRTDDHFKTINYLEKAGDAALLNGSFLEAVQFFKQLLELSREVSWQPSADSSQEADPVLRQAHWEYQLGEAYKGLGQMPDYERQLKTVLKLLGETLPETKRKLQLQLLKQIGIQFLHRLWPSRYLGRGKQTPERLLLLARTYGRLPERYQFRGQSLEALYTSLASANLAELAGPTQLLAYTYMHMCFTVSTIPLLPLARKYNQLSRQIEGKVETELMWQAWINRFDSFFYSNISQYDKARQSAEKALAIFLRLKEWREALASQSTVATFFHAQGKYNAAIAANTDALNVARRYNNIQIQLWALGNLARIALNQGQLEEAERLLQSMETLSGPNTTIFDRLGGTIGWAILHLYRGEYDQARQFGEKLLALQGGALQRTWSSQMLYTATAKVFLTLWENSADLPEEEQSKLQKIAAGACEKLEKYGKIVPIGKVYAGLYQGQYDFKLGKSEQAQQRWQKALGLAEQLDLSYEQGLLHTVLARSTPKDHPSYQTHLTQARRLLLELGANWDLAQLEAESEPNLYVR